jgi:hypothetical protein
MCGYPRRKVIRDTEIASVTRFVPHPPYAMLLSFVLRSVDRCAQGATPWSPVSATTAIRAHHGFGRIRSGGPAIRVVKATKHWERGDGATGAHCVMPLLPWIGDTLIDALVRS